jgi:hypothetical protein
MEQLLTELVPVKHQPEKLNEDDQDERQRKAGKKGRSARHPQWIVSL